MRWPFAFARHGAIAHTTGARQTPGTRRSSTDTTWVTENERSARVSTNGNHTGRSTITKSLALTARPGVVRSQRIVLATSSRRGAPARVPSGCTRDAFRNLLGCIRGRSRGENGVPHAGSQTR
jgi:hypothetical protein